MMFGDGWLVLDGTPLDGSRTLFLDGARATYELKDIQTTFDLAYIDQHGAEDYWMPTLNSIKMNLSEQDERGARGLCFQQVPA